MNLLIIGGTVFLGRHFVETALAAGHQVTLFHRGQHGADLFPAARHVFGDRDGGLDALPNEHWDAVVDCCGYVPRIVRQSAHHLRSKVDRYLFVSTISVYADSSIPGQDESAATGKLEDESVEEITGETYGPLKVLCEREVIDAFAERALIVRPGLIAGPYDPTNRFTYWVDRYAEGGRLIVPARGDQPLQIIDVRDLTAFMLKCLVDQRSGVYNATGPTETYTFGDMLATLGDLWPSSIPVPLTSEDLEANDLAVWQELPLVLPGDGSGDGMMRVSIRRALEAGLSFCRMEETAIDTHSWSQANPNPAPRHGLAREKEQRVLSQFAVS